MTSITVTTTRKKKTRAVLSAKDINQILMKHMREELGLTFRDFEFSMNVEYESVEAVVDTTELLEEDTEEL